MLTTHSNPSCRGTYYGSLVAVQTGKALQTWTHRSLALAFVTRKRGGREGRGEEGGRERRGEENGRGEEGGERREGRGGRERRGEERHRYYSLQ